MRTKLKAAISFITEDATAKASVATRKHSFSIPQLKLAAMPSQFGNRWQLFFARHFTALLEKHENKFNELQLIANKCFFYESNKGAEFLNSINRFPEMQFLFETDTDTTTHTPTSYADETGWANTLIDFISQIYKPSELLDNTSLNEFPDSCDILTAMGIQWFYQAGSCHEQDQNLSMQMLFEAADAMMASHGEFMWHAANNQNIDALREAGKKGANERHAPMRKTKEFAISHYKDNLEENQWPSINFAAFTMIDEVMQYAERVGARLSRANAQRTIAEWIRKSG